MSRKDYFYDDHDYYNDFDFYDDDYFYDNDENLEQKQANMNKYNFNVAISAELNEETVKAIIKQVIEEQTGRKVRAVVLKAGMSSYGFRDEPGYPTFTGCTIQFE